MQEAQPNQQPVGDCRKNLSYRAVSTTYLPPDFLEVSGLQSPDLQGVSSSSNEATTLQSAFNTAAQKRGGLVRKAGEMCMLAALGGIGEQVILVDYKNTERYQILKEMSEFLPSGPTLNRPQITTSHRMKDYYGVIYENIYYVYPVGSNPTEGSAAMTQYFWAKNAPSEPLAAYKSKVQSDE